MIPNTKHRELESKGVTASGTFGISLKDSTHLMTILRDTLYSDRVLAVLREYSSNAWDAHRSIGKQDVPIKVVIPTRADPTLTIQDFGPGLSLEEVFQVYSQYGASTKRDSDNAVGMFGIGSKSGFAYSDSFTIISCHGGKRRTYVAVLDESEAGVINLLHEEDCGDATGVTIQIAVRSNDLWEFANKAKNLYQHFDPRPEINIVLPPLPTTHNVLGHGILYEHNDGIDWLAKMGCVAYKVDLTQLKGQDKRDCVGKYVHQLAGVLNFNIGDLAINASREGLKYTEATKKALIAKIEMLVDEFVQRTITILETGKLHPWDKRIQSHILTRLGLPIPKSLQDLTKESADIKNPPATFALWRNKRVAHDIIISCKTRIILQDDYRKLEGYKLSDLDHLVRPLPGKDLAVVLEELNKLIKDLDIEGVLVINLSTIDWVPSRKKGWNLGKTYPNKKHYHRTFVLNWLPDTIFGPTYSDAWKTITRNPEPEDVFVLLDGFKVSGYDFYYEYKADRGLFEVLKQTMPPIYGYKSTKKKPLTADNITGTEYAKWRKKAITDLVTPEIKEIMELRAWGALFRGHGFYRDTPTDSIITWLGKNHPLSLLLRKHLVALRKLKKIEAKDLETYDARRLLSTQLEKIDSPIIKDLNSIKEERDKLLERYPLLRDQIRELWGYQGQDWANYIKALDFYNMNQKESIE